MSFYQDLSTLSNEHTYNMCGPVFLLQRNKKNKIKINNIFVVMNGMVPRLCCQYSKVVIGLPYGSIVKFVCNCYLY